MANDVRIRFRSYLPGGGFDSAGGAKQGKTRVVGSINVTAYGGDAGEPLSAIDIGLTTIDAISIRVDNESTGPGQTTRTAVYSKSTGHFYVFDVSAAGVKVPHAAATETLEFDALGDSAGDVELT